MMKDWFKKLLGRSTATKRNKVYIDMRYEVHSYKSNEIFYAAKPNPITSDDLDTEIIEQKPTT
ncbi:MULTISPECIES: hypothetical protein [Shewanella]|uniref:Uncharacterized protein n=1 Tax=Shewanella psychromarinicola TaxID=2487742 RepID=A0A3N4DP63_9GAMM|nr:hypothetical protein [Shewanella psychromarinicola]AZG35585.1 hypothetical protein EGC80_12220 [Shewanella psychromarinicola]MCL1081386.1 hypothetical protein [Shewanella psychromarinicola]RPA27665.1 hypothetical protein EGC77_16860 [Shewanella psychromarinicola]